MTFAGERDGEGETREHDAAATSAPGDESPETVEARGEQPADPPTEMTREAPEQGGTTVDAPGAASAEGGGPAPGEAAEGVAAAGGGGDAAPQVGGPVGDALSEAGAEAGDPAAAATDARGDESHVAALPPGSGPAAGAQGAAERRSGSEDSGEASLSDRVEALADQRPEVLVGAAFAGGLVAAKVLAALGGGR